MSPWPLIALSAGLFLPDPRPAPPLDSAPWTAVELPHQLAPADLGETGMVWYRFALPDPPLEALEDPTQLWTVYLPHVNMNAQAFVNGRLVGSGGPFEVGAALNWNRPLRFDFSPALLRPSGNQVHVRLHAYAAYHAGLGQAWVGDLRALEGAFDTQHLFRVSLTRAVTLVCVLLALLMALLWWTKGRDPVFGYISAAVASFAVQSLGFHLPSTPLPLWLHNLVIHASLAWFGVFCTMTTHRWLGVRRPVFERAVWAYGALSTLALAATQSAPLVQLPVHGGAAFLAFYGLVVILKRRERLSRAQRYTVLGGLLFGITMGLHDYLVLAGLLPRDSVRLFAFSGFGLVVSFSAVMLGDFVRTFRRVEARLAAETAIARERERIMRELHDGMGAQLVSAMAMVRHKAPTTEELLDVLGDALDEMRQVIDSLDPDAGDLGTLLATLRMRLEPRLSRQHIRFVWRLANLPEVELRPEARLHVLRLVQEAITNVLKHAEARHITVSTLPSEDALTVEIADDGVGFEPDAVQARRGLPGMRRRAEALGAALSIESAPGQGTRVRLTLPREPEA